MTNEVSIRCQKTPEVGIRRMPAYIPQYTPASVLLSLTVTTVCIVALSGRVGQGWKNL